MRQHDVQAALTLLRTMWPGDMEPEAQLVWASRLAEFDDNDPDVEVTMDACLEMCRFRPTWAEFSQAYQEARKARLSPSRQMYAPALEQAPSGAPNPATRIKEMLAEARIKKAR